jgi:hypothetical protein
MVFFPDLMRKSCKKIPKEVMNIFFRFQKRHRHQFGMHFIPEYDLEDPARGCYLYRIG